MSELILSICIPTYNRANILDKTLTALVNEPAFQSGKIEICISDNASPDNTESMVSKYTNKYDNIIYRRNNENTGVIDGNFPIVAAMASGTFIKFLNDYAYFIPGALDNIIEFVKANKDKKPVLFFPNNKLLNKTSEIIYCDSMDNFVQSASYWTTWVLAAGIWKDDFTTINERDRFIEKFMWCPDNYLRLTSTGRKAIIYNKQFCQFYQLSTKGGYNFFKIFVNNYLSLYEPYLKNRDLSKHVFRTEKYRLFKYYLIPTTIMYIGSNGTQYSFETKGAFKILFKRYWQYPYFYKGITKLAFILLINNPKFKNNTMYQKLKPFIKRSISI